MPWLRRYRARGVNKEDFVTWEALNELVKVVIKDQRLYYSGKPNSFTKLKMLNRQFTSVLKRLDLRRCPNRYKVPDVEFLLDTTSAGHGLLIQDPPPDPAAVYSLSYGTKHSLERFQRAPIVADRTLIESINGSSHQGNYEELKELTNPFPMPVLCIAGIGYDTGCVLIPNPYFTDPVNVGMKDVKWDDCGRHCSAYHTYITDAFRSWDTFSSAIVAKQKRYRFEARANVGFWRGGCGMKWNSTMYRVNLAIAAAKSRLLKVNWSRHQSCNSAHAWAERGYLSRNDAITLGKVRSKDHLAKDDFCKYKFLINMPGK
eukprot:scaffold7243_cov394-Prasinococcus_capsulatus_cf.AAC.26